MASLLQGSVRRRIVERALAGRAPREGLKALRTAMRRHAFRARAGPLSQVSLKGIVRGFDQRTRNDGFQVLRDWNGREAKFHPEIIPVEMLEHFRRLGPRWRASPRHLEVFLDYYLLYVLALFLMRAWDQGDPDENLNRIDELLDALQGSEGSGLHLLDGAEALLWVAISNYHPDEDAYPRLLEKIRALEPSRRKRFALVGAAVLGSHLRWGFAAYYGRELKRLRRDNLCDYPWLLFALTTLMEEYARMDDAGTRGREREEIVCALVNGLTADVPTFTGTTSRALESCRREHERFRELYDAYQDQLREEFEPHRPKSSGYFPIALHFSFPHNLVKGRVAVAMTQAAAPNLPMNALLIDPSGGESDASRRELAAALVGFAHIHSETTTSGKARMIAYDVHLGRDRFAEVLQDP